jgi:hypothetical protein
MWQKFPEKKEALIIGKVTLPRLEAFPGENLFRDCLVELYNAALDLWRWNAVPPL